MNIQDKMQEIHHKFGVTEKANYEIQLFVDDLIKKDRAEQLTLHNVSQQREQLLDFWMKLPKTHKHKGVAEHYIDNYLKSNNCG
tara:strand:+ start:53 stop:304 length:252 start_codon:yes stop_codon:yes gene_type:complete